VAGQGRPRWVDASYVKFRQCEAIELARLRVAPAVARSGLPGLIQVMRGHAASPQYARPARC